MAAAQQEQQQQQQQPHGYYHPGGEPEPTTAAAAAAPPPPLQLLQLLLALTAPDVGVSGAATALLVRSMLAGAPPPPPPPPPESAPYTVAAAAAASPSALLQSLAAALDLGTDPRVLCLALRLLLLAVDPVAVALSQHGGGGGGSYGGYGGYGGGGFGGSGGGPLAPAEEAAEAAAGALVAAAGQALFERCLTCGVMSAAAGGGVGAGGRGGGGGGEPVAAAAAAEARGLCLQLLTVLAERGEPFAMQQPPATPYEPPNLCRTWRACEVHTPQPFCLMRPPHDSIGHALLLTTLSWVWFSLSWYLQPPPLRAAGCLLDQTHGGAGLDLAASRRLTAHLATALKPCLLAANSSSSNAAAAAAAGGGGAAGGAAGVLLLPASACRLLAAVAGRSHPRLVQQLIAADLPEYLFEALRSAQSAVAAAAAAAAGGSSSSSSGSALAAADAAAWQTVRMAVAALRAMALEGEAVRGGRRTVSVTLTVSQCGTVLRLRY